MEVEVSTEAMEASMEAVEASTEALEASVEAWKLPWKHGSFRGNFHRGNFRGSLRWKFPREYGWKLPRKLPWNVFASTKAFVERIVLRTWTGLGWLHSASPHSAVFIKKALMGTHPGGACLCGIRGVMGSHDEWSP